MIVKLISFSSTVKSSLFIIIIFYTEMCYDMNRFIYMPKFAKIMGASSELRNVHPLYENPVYRLYSLRMDFVRNS